MMTDDIVTRLRNMAVGSLYGINIAPFEHYNEAADEIERLREEMAVAAQVMEQTIAVMEQANAQMIVMQAVIDSREIESNEGKTWGISNVI